MDRQTKKYYNEQVKLAKDERWKKRKIEQIKGIKSSQMKKKAKPLSTSKFILYAVYLLCLEIVIFAEISTLILRDTNCLYTLAGIPVALVPTIVSYYMKSKAENTVGGIVYDSLFSEEEKR